MKALLMKLNVTGISPQKVPKGIRLSAGAGSTDYYNECVCFCNQCGDCSDCISHDN